MTWWVRREPGQPAADLDRGPAADARVDLVEHHRRHRVGAGEHHLDGEHHPGQLTAGRALVHRRGAAPGCAEQQQLDLVDAVGARRQRAAADGRARRSRRRCGIGRDLDLQPGIGMASPASSAVTASASLSAASVRAAVSSRRACPTSSAASCLPLGGQLGERVVGAVELGQPARGPRSAQASTPSTSAPYLRVSALQRGLPVVHGGQPRRVGVEPST